MSPGPPSEHDRGRDGMHDHLDVGDDQARSQAPAPEEPRCDRKHRQAEGEIEPDERPDSELGEARCDPEAMVSRDEMRQKFHACADPVLGTARATALRAAAEGLGTGKPAQDLLNLALAKP
ncbi:MAG: hypothetical protein ACKO1H_18875, partial [Tabrizicola sp.]